jgi:hypothetical protein
MTILVPARAFTRAALVHLLRDGPRPKHVLVEALVSGGHSAGPGTVSKILTESVRDGIIARTRYGWYGPVRGVRVVERPTLSERIYSHLEGSPGATATQIAQALGCTEPTRRPIVYARLAELEALGWARRTGDRPARWYVTEER